MKPYNPIIICVLILVFFGCDVVPVEKKKPVIVHKVKKKPVLTPLDKVADTLNIAAVGDLMLGTSYPNEKNLPPDSAKGSFNAALNELKNADVTFGNLEGTLINNAKPAPFKLKQVSKAWLFKMPPYYGNIFKDAGFKVVSLANNHIGDFGDTGRTSTMKVLDSLGIYYGGQVKHPSALFKIKGLTIGFCAFAPNANTLPILQLKNAANIIYGLKKQCDVLIVSFHGGGEGPVFEHIPFKMESYLNQKRGNVNAFAHTAIDAGADLVFGNGPHVCRAMELYKNRLIAYSLGNFCTYRCVSVAGVCGIAPLLKVVVNKKGEFINGKIVSYKQTHNKGLLPDSLNKAAQKIKELTETDFPDAGILIAYNGQISKKP